MKLILLEDVKSIGKKGQLINSSDGYAKNYLIPKGLAVEATNSNMNTLEQKKKTEEKHKLEELENAKELAKSLEEKKINIKVKTGENGKLFGAVTNKEIGVAIEEQTGIKIDKKKIELGEPIKMVGKRHVTIKIYPKVNAEIEVVISEV